MAWQCLALSENGTVIIGEVSPVHKAPRPKDHVFDGRVRMTSLSHGQIINRGFSKAQDLKKNEQYLIYKFQLQGDYEPRMLRIPGLLVTAVWLKSLTAGGTDWVVPIHAKLRDLQNDQKEIYRMDEFLPDRKGVCRNPPGISDF